MPNKTIKKAPASTEKKPAKKVAPLTDEDVSEERQFNIKIDDEEEVETTDAILSPDTLEEILDDEDAFSADIEETVWE